MMKSYSFLHFVAIFCYFLCLAFAHAHNNNHESTDLQGKYKDYFSKVYAFGDSYTDTGNGYLLGGLVNSVTNSTKYGEAFRRLCNGRLVIDFLCDALSLPPLPPFKGGASADFSHGVNFAVAGATALSADYFVKGKIDTLIWKKNPVSFQTQINWYKKFQLEIGSKGKNETSCKAEMENTLFWVGVMGVNDYTRIIGSSVSLRWLAERNVIQVSRLLKTLLDGGAKYVVVEGLPPMGCLPVGMSQQAVRDQMGCVATVNTAVMIHNQILQRKLKSFQQTYPKCSILYADNWNAYLTILTNPTKYMFQEPFKVCCGAGGGELNFNRHSLCGSPGTSTCSDAMKHITWDGIHLTEAMNWHLTDLFLNQGFCRPSFGELIKSKSGM